jgi:hypothetical protein
VKLLCLAREGHLQGEGSIPMVHVLAVHGWNVFDLEKWSVLNQGVDNKAYRY